MPTLRQLTCRIEKGSANVPLREYNTIYGDGVVSTYVGIPTNPTTFSVHLTSEGFIAHGLAMFVFIDGVTQCNRNRRDLQEPGPDVEPQDTEINFRVRQKEINGGNGQFVAHDWRFDGLKTAAADKVSPSAESRRHGIGTIEVVVLRCQGTKSFERRFLPKPKSGTVADRPAANTKGSLQSDRASSLGGIFGLFGADGVDEDPGARRIQPWLYGLDGTDDWGGAMPGAWQSSPPEDSWGQSNDADNTWGTGDDLGNTNAQGDEWGQPTSSALQQRSKTKRCTRAKSASDTVELVWPGAQVDGPPELGKATPNGIVINQYVNGGIEQPKPNENVVRQALGPASAPYASAMPWLGLYPPFQPPMYPQMLPPQYQAEFMQFLALKQAAGQANVNAALAGQSNQVQEAPGDQEPAQQSSGGGGGGAWGAQDNNKSGDNNDNNNDDSWNQPNNDSGGTGGGAWDDTGNQTQDNQQSNNDSNGQTNNQPGGWDDTNAQANTTGNQNTNAAWGDNTNDSSQKENKPSTNKPSRKSQKKPPSAPEAQPSSNTKPPSNTVAPLDFDPSQPYTRPYWSNWKADLNVAPPSPPKPPKPARNPAREASAARTLIYPPPPPSKVHPSDITAAKLSHQVHTGRGAVYQHSTSRPTYLDSMEKPYGVFIFKYRSNLMLEEILGDGIQERKFDRGSYRERLQRARREDVVEELMRLKSALGVGTDSSAGSDLEGEGSEGGGDGGGGGGGVKNEEEKKKKKKKSGGSAKKDADKSKGDADKKGSKVNADAGAGSGGGGNDWEKEEQGANAGAAW